MNHALMFSSLTPEWETPPELFAPLQAEFCLDLDVCATAENAKCARYFTRAQDGLALPWVGRCWMNPPYGRTIGAWVRKAQESTENRDATLVVCLLPARTDTRWWHQYIWDLACHRPRRGVHVRFLKGRVKFLLPDGTRLASAPFPSCLVVFTQVPHDACLDTAELERDAARFCGDTERLIKAINPAAESVGQALNSLIVQSEVWQRLGDDLAAARPGSITPCAKRTR